MATYVPAKKNTEYIFYAMLIDQSNTKLAKVNPTLATGDAKVSIDGGAFTNLGTLPAATPAAGAAIKVTLAAAEMNGDNIAVLFSDASGSEWCDLLINIQTTTKQVDDLAVSSTALTNAMWTDAKAGYLDVAVSSRNAVAPLDAAGTRGALGMGTANLDTQLSGIPLAVWNVLNTTAFILNSMGEWIKAKLDVTVGSRNAVTPLDAAGTRGALGMATNNLDTQLAGIPAADDAVLTAVHGAGSWQAGVFILTPGDAATIATAVDAAMTASHGAGSWQRVTGAAPNTVTYVLEASGNPVAGGQVWVYTDLACTNLVAYGISDTFGQITFYLAAGTYYVKRFKDNVTIFTPTVITMVVT